MRSIEQKFQVGFRFPVHFTEGVFSARNPLLAQALRLAQPEDCRKVLCVVDSNVEKHHPRLIADINAYGAAHPDVMRLVCQPLVTPGGEIAKNDSRHLHTILQAINDHGICRHSFVIAIGGGAILDLIGYAAAIAHRGVRHIRIPTTVLSQNDSGVGVKNSVNAFGKKNFLGTFAPPTAVINDRNFLTTLDQRDWLAGISEAVKVGLIKDGAFYRFVESTAASLVSRNMDAMQRVIERCAELHLQHIAWSGDPFESGTSRPLDFGHWAAHKLEQMTDFKLRHGEGVAIGIALDVTYSALIGELAMSDAQSICRCLADLDLPIYDAAMRNAETLLEGLQEFREHLGGQLTITLLRGIGAGFETHAIDRAMMLKAIDTLAQHAQAAAVA
jgi:3-dehydroquinate synthase